jgi:hypothetical protein
MLGVALGLLFGICLLTGLLSHLIQQPPGWFAWPSRPVWLYRWTQGLHVFCGIAAIPVLLAKLWSVYPHLWRWPPVRGGRPRDRAGGDRPTARRGAVAAGHRADEHRLLVRLGLRFHPDPTTGRPGS